MDPKAELVERDETAIGLDRTNITSENKIELPNLESDHSSEYEQSEPESRSSSSLVKSLKHRKHRAGLKLRKTLHISKASDGVDSQTPVLANTAEEQSDSRLIHQLPVPEKATFKDFIHNPVDTVKSKISDQGNQEVAANIAAKEVSHGNEVDLINAHDAIGQATTERDRLLATKDVSKLMKERQGTYAKWSLDRHVTKIRVLPRDTMVRKSQADFRKQDSRGKIVTDWHAYAAHLVEFYAHQYGGQYIGYGSNPPPPSKETIMPNIERLIVATSPFQEFMMTTRRVYRWEHPAETVKYLLVYSILWYFNLLLPGALSMVLYLIVERRVHGNTLEDLREDIKHREDTQRTALSINEFIAKRGDEKWADEIVEVLGPWLMVQLADMANFFESIRNFYEWRKPTRTGATVALLACIVIACALMPTWFLVKASTLNAGLCFFGLFPIAVNFPDYRLLVSPTKRLFWNIPTHAEWAIKYIQAEGTRVAANNLVASENAQLPSAVPIKTTPEDAQNYNYGFYEAHHEKSKGELVISAGFCRFAQSKGNAHHFQLSYSEIERIEKQDRVVAKKIPSRLKTDSGKDLKLVTKSGQEYLLSDMDERDEAFSQIVGFSQTTWQILW